VKFKKGDIIQAKISGRCVRGEVTKMVGKEVWAIWEDDNEESWMSERDVRLVSRRRVRMKFEVGDEVRVVRECPKKGCAGECVFVGDIGKVKEIGHGCIGVDSFKKNKEWCNGFVEDCLELVSSLSEEESNKREFIEKKKREKENRKSVISVSSNVHNRFASTLNHFDSSRPVCYMLGKNNKGVIVDFVNLRPVEGDGCGNMPYISGTVMANAIVKLCQKGFVSCGIARVGDFNLGETSERGNSLYEISKMSGGNGIIISYSKEGVKIERKMKRGIKEYVYNVVEERR